MKISVVGHRVDVGDALRTHVEEKMESHVRKYFDHAIEGKAILTKESHLHRFSISVHVGRGIFIQGNDTNKDPYVAFEAALSHVERRLRRSKRRLQDRSEQAQQKAELIANKYIIFSESKDDDVDENVEKKLTTSVPEDEAFPAVIAEMEFEISDLSVSEAIERLDTTRIPALLFRNSAHGGLSMIYRREDGNIGWVDPKLKK
ncbi:MAG: ribosome hibernation-promoting factor, HPF/YfiA family [Alphaproteobacteria bacterium]